MPEPSSPGPDDSLGSSAVTERSCAEVDPVLGLRHFPGVWMTPLSACEDLNPALLHAFERYAEDAGVRRSHWLGGRFENVYLPPEKVPRMAEVLDAARWAAGKVLGLAPGRLRAASWYNVMRTGDRTYPHTHDDDDELLSGVYYVRVPDASGLLRLRRRGSWAYVRPREGMLVLFPPDLEHEVTAHRGLEPRVSLGINLGPTPAANHEPVSNPRDVRTRDP